MTLTLPYRGRTIALTAIATGALVATAPLEAQDIVRESRQLLKQALIEQPDLEYDPYGVLIRYVPGTTENERAQVRSLIGGHVARSYRLVPDLEKVTTVLPVDATLWLLADHPAVAYIEPDFVIRLNVIPNDPDFGDQWACHNTGQRVGGIDGKIDADIDMREGWDLSTGNNSAVVAVIDTGFDHLHPDLQQNIWTNPGEIGGNGIDDDGNGFIDDLFGWDFYDDDADPSQTTDGHGTSVAGIIGARGDNGIGVTGVLWVCRMVDLRVFGPGGTGVVSDAIAALDYAVGENVFVSNNSWGTFSFSQGLRDSIEASRAIDHCFVAASGNDDRNDNDSNPYYPASFTLENIVSVCATNSRDRLANFSNIGATSVDVGAPGVRVRTTRPMFSYGNFSGTSAAAPHAAGLIALAKAAHPEWTYNRCRDRLRNQTRPIADLQGVTVSGGLINAALLLEKAVAVPGNPVAMDLGGGVVDVKWEDRSNNETRFIVQRETKFAPGIWGEPTFFVLGADTESLTDIPGFGVYKYRVRARNRGYWSAWTRWDIVVAR